MSRSQQKKTSKKFSRTTNGPSKALIENELRAIGRRITKLEKTLSSHTEHLRDVQSEGFIESQSEKILEVLRGELQLLAHRFDQGTFNLADLIELMNNPALRNKFTMVGSELVKTRSAGSPVPINAQAAVSANFRK